MSLLKQTLDTISEPDSAAAAEVQRLLDGKTKPVGSLGRVEEIACRLAGIYGRVDLRTRPRAVVVMAADHGVTARGVSAYPAEVTAQMVLNMVAGGAAVNVLARQMEARAIVVDMGVNADIEWPSEVRREGISRGTRDLSIEPAMEVAEAVAALEAGIRLADELSDDGVRIVAAGDMGIGNTTSASVLTAAFTGTDATQVTGRGTGVDDAGFALKTEVVRNALERHRLEQADPLEVLAAVGGFEIAGLAGLILGAAVRRCVIVIDGFVSSVAALVATRLAPRAKGFLIASHRSVEPGHGYILEDLGLEPLFDLGLRLGEGSGALLAFPLIDAASRIVVEMESFESAGVSRQS